MGKNTRRRTVAEWLIEELADYDTADLFFDDTLKEFKEDKDMANLEYSLDLLYRAQKELPSELLDKVNSLRGRISVANSIKVMIELEIQTITSENHEQPNNVVTPTSQMHLPSHPEQFIQWPSPAH